MNINKISNVLYKAARLSRDVNAVTRGPGAIGRRIVRKGAGRAVNGPLQQVLNKLIGR